MMVAIGRRVPNRVMFRGDVDAAVVGLEAAQQDKADHTGEQDQAEHRPVPALEGDEVPVGLDGEQAPGLSVRFTGINRSAIASYLVTLYNSLAVLTDDALAVLDDVAVDKFYEYK